MMKRIRASKKGSEFSTALVDFYATLIIVTIVVVFFLLTHYASNTVEFTLEEQEGIYGLDANRLALVFAQSDVETSKGTMSYAELIALAAYDTTMKQELQQAVENYFSFYVGSVKHYVTPYGTQADTGDIGIGITIYAVVDEKRTTLALFQNPQYKQMTSMTLTLPLPEEHDYAEIAVEVKQ